MTDDTTLIRGTPDRESTLDLLNEAYGDWGDERLFHWKYEDYPNYEADHVFSLVVNDELAAFRRMYDKEIVVYSRPNYRFFVLGDTCVSPNHRGQGLYSRLHAETTRFCRAQGRDFSCTFNRVGNITHKANLDRGWQYRTLPVNINILSPESVLPKYAQLAIEEGERIDSLLKRIGHRVGIAVGGSEIRAHELVGTSSDAGTLYVPVPERVLPPLIEIASSTDPAKAIRRRIKRKKVSETPESIATTIRSPGFDEELVDRIYDLYKAKSDEYSLHFRRNRKDIRHMLSHPYLEAVVIAEEDEDMVGFAPVCLNTNEEVLEAQVLDIVAVNEGAFAALTDEIELIGLNHDADLIVTITDSNPGPDWARIDRQVMMWDEYDTDTSPLVEESLRIGLYDVV